MEYAPVYDMEEDAHEESGCDRFCRSCDTSGGGACAVEGGFWAGIWGGMAAWLDCCGSCCDGLG
jgi:hypothetical protein